MIADHGTAWNALKLGQIDETIISSDTWLRERANPELTPIISFHRFYTDEYAFNPAVPLIRFDPAEAKRILAEAGWVDRNGDGVLEKNGRTFTLELLIIPGSAATTQFTQTVQAEMKKVGVQIDIRAIDGAANMQQVRAGNFDAAYLGWELDADPDPHSLFHSSQFPPRGQNFIFYSNPEADRLIDAARRELDLSRRTALYRRLHEVLAEDQPYTWTIQVSAKWGIRKRLRGVSASRGYGLFNWYPGELDWFVSPPTKVRL